MSEPNSAIPVSKSPFWQFSIKFYAVPGVAEACIALQDQAKVDVNILFYLLWNATQGRAFNAADVTEIERRIGPWRDIAVVPTCCARCTPNGRGGGQSSTTAT